MQVAVGSDINAGVGSRMSETVVRNFTELRALRTSMPVATRFRSAKQFFHTQSIGREWARAWQKPLQSIQTTPNPTVLGWDTPDLVELLGYEIYSAPVNWVQVLALEQIVLAATVTGKYATARGALKQLEGMVGPSLWAENIQFFIHEHEQGWEAQKDLLIHRFKTAEEREDLQEIWYFISRKNERDSAADVFEADIHEIFTGRASNDLRRFLRMWLRPWLPPQLDDLRAHAAAATFLPLFDKFHALIFICRGIANLGELKRSPTRETFLFLAESTADTRLRTALAMTVMPELLHGLVDRTFIGLCDAYTTTRQAVAADLRRFLEEHTLATNAYELWMKAALREAIPLESIGSATFLDRVTSVLYRYGAHVEPVVRRVGDLHNIIKLYPDATVAAGLYGMLHAGVGASQGLSAPFASHLLASPVSPRELVHTTIPAEPVFEQIRARYPESASLVVQGYIQGRNELSIECRRLLPQSRRHYYAACRAERAGRLAEAFAEYRLTAKLLQASPAASPLDKLSAIRGAFRIAARAVKMKDALQVALSGFAANPEFVYSLEVKDYIERARILGSWAEFKNDPKLAIVASLYGLDSFKVYLFVKGTLRRMRVKLPSKIRPKQLAAKTRLMFWEKTCTSDVLSRIVDLATTDEIEQERMRLCELAIQMGSDNEEGLRREYSRLAYDQIVRTGLGWLDQSKLYVDVPAVLAKTAAELEDAYGNMQRYEVMAQRLKASLNAGRRNGRQEQETIIEACRIFSLREYTRIVETLGNTFVQDNSYGLDAYIGLYMRHGSFRNHLTAIFERHGLLDASSTDIPKGRRRSYSPLEAEAARFRDGVVKLLEDFRTNRLVATTEDQPKAAAFKIRLGASEIARGHARHRHPDCSLAEIQRDVLEGLWKQVSDCAHAVCCEALPELREEVLRYLDQLRVAAQQTLLNDEQRGRVLASIAACATDFQNELQETVAPWFKIADKRPELKHDLMTLGAIAVAQVQARHPKAKIHVPREGIATGTVRHENIYPFVEILNIFIENIYLHSGQAKTGIVNGKIYINQANGLLTLVVSNPVNGDTAAAVARMQSKLDGAGADDADIRRSGGTGLRKARKLLREDLGRRDCTFTPSLDGPGRVRLVVRFRAEGFLV